MNTRAETGPSAATVSTYERLRGLSLEARWYLAGELGLNVLLRQGMLAWTRICPAPLAPSSLSAAPLDRTRVPSPVHEDIIHVMVAMATSLSASIRGEAMPA